MIVRIVVLLTKRRDGDGEVASPTEIAVHPDAPAVRLHDLPADGETEAAAAGRARAGDVHANEPVEDPRQGVPGDAGAGVGDREPRLAVAMPGGDRHLA